MAETAKNEAAIVRLSELSGLVQDALGLETAAEFYRLAKWMGICESVGAVGDLAHLHTGYAIAVRDKNEVEYRVAVMQSTDPVQYTYDYVRGNE